MLFVTLFGLFLACLESFVGWGRENQGRTPTKLVKTGCQASFFPCSQEAYWRKSSQIKIDVLGFDQEASCLYIRVSNPRDCSFFY